MNRKKYLRPLALLVVAGLIQITGSEARGDGFYTQLGASYLSSSEFDSEPVWDALVGFSVSDSLGLEFQTGIYGFDKREPLFDRDFDVLPFLFNVRYTQPVQDVLLANLGAGAGISITEFNISPNETGEDVVFTGHLFGGLLWSPTAPLHVLLNYRLIYLDDADEGEASVEAELYHGPELALRVTF